MFVLTMVALGNHPAPSVLLNHADYVSDLHRNTIPFLRYDRYRVERFIEPLWMAIKADGLSLTITPLLNDEFVRNIPHLPDLVKTTHCAVAHSKYDRVE